MITMTKLQTVRWIRGYQHAQAGAALPFPCKDHHFQMGWHHGKAHSAVGVDLHPNPQPSDPGFITPA